MFTAVLECEEMFGWKESGIYLGIMTKATILYLDIGRWIKAKFHFTKKYTSN